MLTGILAGLATGALWGLTFVAPRVVQPFTELDLAIGRYVLFGILSFALMLHPRFRAGGISRARIGTALLLGGIGYVGYYLCAAYAVSLAGPAIPPLIIGALPVLLAIIGNWQDGGVRWRRLVVPLVLIFVGLGVVNLGTMEGAATPEARSRILIGALCALAALAIWIVYGVWNARVMRASNPPDALVWTGLQGLGALLFSVPLLPVSYAIDASALPVFGFGSPEGLRFLVWIVMLAVFASWLATWLWSIASRRLPLALSAQLIVSETVFALIYGFVYETRWPYRAEWLGTGLLIVGVIAGVRVFARAGARRDDNSRRQTGGI
jgi:drug/metabolite transporter (DMT)-like permease